MVSALSLMMLPTSVLSGAEARKREFRSAWISTAWRLDWPQASGAGTTTTVVNNQKAELTKYLESLAAQNYTAAFFQVRARSDAFYKSNYAPWSSDVSGARGTNPGWDPLEYAVSEAHRLGLELHAWINPYRWSTTATDWTTSKDKTWINNGWILRYSYVDSNNSTKYLNYLNPGIEGVSTLIKNVAEEILTGYDIDGLVIDDYFYPNGIPHDSSAGDYELYLSKRTSSSQSIGDWRRSNVNAMVKTLYDLVQEVKPDVRFGIAPPGVSKNSEYMDEFPSLSSSVTASDYQYDGQATDPLYWLKSGIVDYISPQIYWAQNHATAPYEPLSEWWSKVAAQVNRHFYSSNTISAFYNTTLTNPNQYNTESNWAERVAQVEINRKYTLNNAPGYCMFSIAYLNGPKATGFGAYLAANATSGRTLTPEITWKNDRIYDFGAVGDAKKSGTKLTWTAAAYSNRIVRYTVYAVPDSETKETAARSDGDGLKQEYLLGVTYSNSYTLPTAKQSGYWYAVSVYDGFGKEHEASYIDYPQLQGPAPQTTLLSPDNGSAVEGTITFVWSDVAVDGYTLQISSSSSFSNILYSQDFSSTSGSLTAAQLGTGTFYWRVVSKKENYQPTYSESNVFIISKSALVGAESGYTVQTDNSVYRKEGQVTMSSLWARSASIGNFSTSEMNAGLHRMMTVSGDNVYIVERTATSSTASSYLRKYNRFTGEYLGRLSLSASVQTAYAPCNSIMRDDKGVVCVANLVTDLSKNPLLVHKVNLETGGVTQVASLQNSELTAGRIDYATLIGDVEAGEFTVFAAVASTNTVLRWKISGGKTTASRTTIASRYPASASNLGLAPTVFAMSDDDIFVNGFTTAFTRYKFVAGGNAVLMGSFETAPASVKLTTATYNGGMVFDFGGRRYVCFPIKTAATGVEHQFCITKTNAAMDYSTMEHNWTIPMDGASLFTDYNNSIGHSQIDCVMEESGKDATFYTYVPGDGIAAYRIHDLGYSTGVEAIGQEQALSVVASRNGIYTGAEADEINVYSLSGALIANGSGNRLNVKLQAGYYVVSVKADGRLQTKGVVVR